MSKISRRAVRQRCPHQDGSKTPKSVASSGSQSPKVPFCLVETTYLKVKIDSFEARGVLLKEFESTAIRWYTAKWMGCFKS